MKFLTVLLIISLNLNLSFAATKLGIIQELEALYKATAVGAVAYALVEDDEIIATGGFGEYGNEDHRPVTESSLFRIGSITKTFTAIAVMQQVEKGKLQLHQSITSYLPDIPLSNPFTTAVTLEMLLEHTSGLQDLSRKEFNYPVPVSLQQAFQVTPEARQVKWEPGYHYSYTNAGAGYLGRVIEVINKTDYDSWFETHILSEMGMNHSSLLWSKEVEQQLVTGYNSDLKTKIPYWHTLFRPFGGLNTTALDMAKFLTLFTSHSNSAHNRTKIISEASIKRMETPTTTLAAKAGQLTGYGLALRNELVNGHRIYGHGGDGDGYLAHFSYSKESHRGYFVVINAFRNDIENKFSNRLNLWLIAKLKINPKNSIGPKDKVLKMTEMKKIAGEYQQFTSRFSRKSTNRPESIYIKIKNQRLYRCYRKNSQCRRIYSKSAELFRVGENPHVSMAIIKASDGKYYLQYFSENYRRIH